MLLVYYVIIICIILRKVFLFKFMKEGKNILDMFNNYFDIIIK